MNPATARILQAYDQHLNMVLGEVEETITTTETDHVTFEEIVKKETRCVLPRSGLNHAPRTTSRPLSRPHSEAPASPSRDSDTRFRARTG